MHWKLGMVLRLWTHEPKVSRQLILFARDLRDRFHPRYLLTSFEAHLLSPDAMEQANTKTIV